MTGHEPFLGALDPGAVRRARENLAPLLSLALSVWPGLAPTSLVALAAALGPPVDEGDVVLGWYPARRFTFPLETPSGGLAAYVRAGQVEMVETLRPPPLAAAAALGEPCAVLPHELVVEGAYVHEKLYCARGLVLSVTEPFAQGAVVTVMRCRGFHPIERPDQFGPELHRDAEHRRQWGGVESIDDG